MQTELQRQHERHKAFHQEIARRAAQLRPIIKRTYEIPNTPYGVPKILPPRSQPVFVLPIRPLPDAEYDEAWHIEICGQSYAEPRVERVTIRSIQIAICRFYKLTMAELLSRSHQARVTKPRFVGFWLSRELTMKSLPEIGRAFAGRDHTTVLHGLRRAEEWIVRNDPIANDIETIKESL